MIRSVVVSMMVSFVRPRAGAFASSTNALEECQRGCFLSCEAVVASLAVESKSFFEKDSGALEIAALCG